MVGYHLFIGRFSMFYIFFQNYLCKFYVKTSCMAFRLIFFCYILCNYFPFIVCQYLLCD